MGKQAMVCGADCQNGDANCNGYCIGKSNSPPDATEEMILLRAREKAHRILDDATRAWHAYAALCDDMPERVKAFDVFENLRTARYVGA